MCYQQSIIYIRKLPETAEPTIATGQATLSEEMIAKYKAAIWKVYPAKLMIMDILYPNRWTQGVAMVRPDTEFRLHAKPNIIPPNCGAEI